MISRFATRFLILAILFLGGLPCLAQTDLTAIANADFSVRGSVSDERLGQRVAMGDVNGDGYADVILCTRFFDPPVRQRAGGVFIFFGGEGPALSGDLSLASVSADLAIWGASAEDRLGMSFESSQAPVALGRLNEDEFDDLIIGAPNASPGNLKEAGAVYVFFGRSDFPELIDLAETSADLVITGSTEGAHLGSALTAGDLDGDGMGDLILGSPLYRRGSVNPYGRIDVIAGGNYLELEGTWDLSTQPADWSILGASEQEELGDCLATGDANGDGIGDLLIGVSGAHVEAYDKRGKCYLFLGRSDRFSESPTDLTLEQADCTIFGASDGDLLGQAVGIYPIFSGTAEALLIGAPRANAATEEIGGDQVVFDVGAVYILSGKSEFPLKIDFAFEHSDVTIYGATHGDALGYQVAGGRVVSATRKDLIIGSFRADRSGSVADEGLVAILPGEMLEGGPGQIVYLGQPQQEYRIWGGRLLETFCTGLAVGDADGDGRQDILGGAADSRDSGGRAYLFYAGSLLAASDN